MIEFCDICQKKYASKKSLWNHNKRFHIQNEVTIKNQKKIVIEKPKCSYCHKILSSLGSLKRHLITCKTKINRQIKDNKTKNIQVDEILNILSENNLVKNPKIQKFLNSHNISDSYNSSNDLTTEHGHINNHGNQNNIETLNTIGTQNNIETQNTQNTQNNININISRLGDEDLVNILTPSEQRKILRKKRHCLEYMVKYIHFNKKYPQFRNVFITNLNNPIAYEYDPNIEEYVAINKDELLSELINSRVNDIYEFKTLQKDNLDDNTNNIINDLVEDIENKSTYCNNKKRKIKTIIYNNTPKINGTPSKLLKVISDS